MRLTRLLLVPTGALLVLFILIPAIVVLQEGIYDGDGGFTTRHFERIFAAKVYLNVLVYTVMVSAIVAVIGTIVAYPAAYFIRIQPSRTRSALMFMVFVPLWMSILIRTFSWMIALGRDGIVNKGLLWAGLIESPLQMLFTSGSMYLAMVQILLPIQIITCYAAMTEIDWDLVRAARILGATGREAFRRVFLPMSLHGVVNSIQLSFILSMGFFITPALLGGRRNLMFANLIERQVAELNWAFAASLGVVLLVTSLVITAGAGALGRAYAARVGDIK